MRKLVIGRKATRRDEAHLPAATDMFTNAPTVTSRLHIPVWNRRLLRSRMSSGETSQTEAEALFLSRSFAQCYLTKEQCFQCSGLTRSENTIGPFLPLLATALSHRPHHRGPGIWQKVRSVRPSQTIRLLNETPFKRLASNGKLPQVLGIDLNLPPPAGAGRSHSAPKGNLTRTQSLRVLASRVESASLIKVNADV